MAEGTKNSKKAHLIVSDETEPTVKLKAGMRFEVTAISVVDPTLKKAEKVAARLCGGTSTCLALTEI